MRHTATASAALFIGVLLSGCTASRSDGVATWNDDGPIVEEFVGECILDLVLEQVGVGDPVVLQLTTESACTADAVVEVGLGVGSEIVTLVDGSGRARLACPERARTARARFLAAGLSGGAGATVEVDCGVPPTPVPRDAQLVAPARMAAYRCEAGELTGVAADDVPPVLCVGPGLRLTHPDAVAVPCESCASACAAALPAAGGCWRLTPSLDDQGRYRAGVQAQASWTGGVAACAQDPWGRTEVTSTQLTGVGFVGAWVTPSRLDLGPEYRSGEGRACAQVNGMDGRPLRGAPLAFESLWDTVFVDARGVTGSDGVACVNLLATGAIAPSAQVRVRLADTCAGAGGQAATAPVRAVSNPPSPSHSRLTCAPEVMPAFAPGSDASADCELRLRDRFGDLTTRPVEVGFATEAGLLQAAQVLSVEGRAHVALRAGGDLPRDVAPVPGEPALRADDGVERNPRDGYVTLIAWWQGEEGFADDGDGIHERHEPFLDLGEPWVDADDDGAWSEDERFVAAAGGDSPGRAAGNGRWDAHGIVWTETRVIWTDAPDPAAALDELQGCELSPGDGQGCGEGARAFLAVRAPCRLSIPLYDERLNPPAGAWTPTLTLGRRQDVRLTSLGGAGWEFRRSPGLGGGAFTRGVGFQFDGPTVLTAHLSSNGPQLQPTDLTLSVAYEIAPGRPAAQADAALTGCAAR